MRNVVIIEPYHGGSHAVFVDTLMRHSRHRCTLVSLPARKWKWRMRGAAMWLTRQGGDWMRTPVDVILCNDMISVADLRALLPRRLLAVPIACYFHENQLTYPLPDWERRDFQYGMTNISSALTADAVWFNSAYHRDAFLSAADDLLAKMPDYRPTGVTEEIRNKSAVLPPPVAVDAAHSIRRAEPGRPTRILWCHRWEFDKNPSPFFDALIRLDEEGIPFELVLTGEQFRTAPSVFQTARKRLAHRIVHAGHVESRADYLDRVATCDLVVSTAIQENFGLGVAEAVLAGCQPLLPRRLAYPEVIPAELHGTCLYDDDSTLLPRLRRLTTGQDWLHPEDRVALTASLRGRFAPSVAVAAIDAALCTLAAGSRP